MDHVDDADDAAGPGSTPAELRDAGPDVVEWVGRYLDGVADRPVLPRWRRGGCAPSSRPTRRRPPSPGTAILADLDRVVVPGTTHWQSPGWYAYFQSNSSAPAVLAEALIATLGTQGMLWRTGPACTEVETLVLDWLAELLGLPDRFRSDGPGGGVIQDSASSSTLVRRWPPATGPVGRAPASTTWSPTRRSTPTRRWRRASGSPACCPSSSARRRSTPAAALDPVALRGDGRRGRGRRAGAVPRRGHGRHHVDPRRSTRSAAIAEVTRAARRLAARRRRPRRRRGRLPRAPLDPRRAGAGRQLRASTRTSGCSRPWTARALYVADAEPLADALSITPEYLRNAATGSGEVVDYRDWQVPLGRRFRALKLWTVIRRFGADGLRARASAATSRLAQDLADRLRGRRPLRRSPLPVPLNLVCFGLRAGDEAGEALLDALNATGRVALSHTRIDGRFLLRVSVGQTTTTGAHVEELWRLIDRLAPPA